MLTQYFTPNPQATENNFAGIAKSTALQPLPSPYTGPPDPLLERLTERGYSRHRSRLVDRWVALGIAVGFFGEVAV